MIACDEDFVSVWQFYKPVEEIKHFLFCSIISEVATMYDDICSWQVCQLPVPVVGVGDLEDSQGLIVHHTNGRGCGIFQPERVCIFLGTFYKSGEIRTYMS